ncbi:MAG: histidine kinase [Caulobacterales bacterium]|nr:histidine kinase [Caulobacterales bacterium]
MAPRIDSLALRLAAVMLAGVVVLQLGIVVLAIWPDGRRLDLRLPAPQDAAAMARAVEAAPKDVQPLVVAALNRGAMRVELADPAALETGHDAPATAARITQLLGGYAGALEGRPFEVQARQGQGPLRDRLAPGTLGPVRLVVRLRTGQVLLVERTTAPLLRRLGDRSLPIALLAASVMLAVLAVSLWTIRPIDALARAAPGIADDVAAADLPVRGAREVRALSTALNALRRRIRALLDERTRVLAAIAHDLRTYLTRLRLRAEFIADPEQRERAAADLEEMGQLLDDTLLFARDAARAEAAGEVDVRAEVAALAARRRELGQPVEDATADDDAVAARGSPLAVRRMLDNLVDNAVRYGGGARLCVRRDGAAVVIAVDDDGPGAPPEALGRLVRPFERLEPSRGRDTGGSGLGLAIVKALAESQGGALTLENRPEGGLRATVRLVSR